MRVDRNKRIANLSEPRVLNNLVNGDALIRRLLEHLTQMITKFKCEEFGKFGFHVKNGENKQCSVVAIERKVPRAHKKEKNPKAPNITR